MKTVTRVMSMLLVLLLCVGMLAACGGNSDDGSDNTKAPATDPAPATSEATEPFVAPPDQVGLVTSADSQLVTWQPYATEGDTVDFKSLDVNALGEAGEMTVLYMEKEVTYYSLVNGKLEEAAVEDILAGSIIGVTTLEEGVQEVYILYIPAVDDGSEDTEDPLGEIVEETIPSETEGEQTEDGV